MYGFRCSDLLIKIQIAKKMYDLVIIDIQLNKYTYKESVYGPKVMYKSYSKHIYSLDVIDRR